MVIYHGSQFILRQPTPRGGKPDNDYGYGFYCSEIADMAREWSVTSEHNGYINSYEFNDEGLKILNLNEYPVLTWLAVLLENRVFDIGAPIAKEARNYIIDNFMIDYREFDVIKGYRADDSYFSFAKDFINNTISYEQLCEAMHLGKLGEQIVLKSKKSFECLKWISAERVSKDIWFPKRESRDKKARKDYFSMDKKYVKGQLYVFKIIDEEIGRDDERVR